MAQQYDVTSVGVNPAEDRARRMRTYFIAMTIRILCVISLFWVRGWWVLLVGLAVVILPYFAVLVANAVAHDPGQQPDAPTPLELTGTEPVVAEPGAPSSAPSATLIVVDAPAERRASSPAEAAEPSPSDRDGASDDASDDPEDRA